MLYSCRYCGGIHQYGFNCCNKVPRIKRHTQQTDIRSTNRWTHKSFDIRKRDNYLCRVCLDHGVVRYATEVHHIIPLEEDFSMAFEDGWLLSLCDSDHKKAEAGKYGRAYLHKLATTSPPSPNDLHRG